MPKTAIGKRYVVLEALDGAFWYIIDRKGTDKRVKDLVFTEYEFAASKCEKLNNPKYK